jgi:hypothetical protein
MYRYDPETELFLSDMSDRPYGSVTGRFTREDDIGIAGGDTDLFRYCANCAGPNCGRNFSQIKTVRILGC